MTTTNRTPRISRPHSLAAIPAQDVQTAFIRAAFPLADRCRLSATTPVKIALLTFTGAAHQAYALLGLCQKYGEGRVEAICGSALAFDVVSVPCIAAMLKSAAKPISPADTQGRVAQLTLPRFARPAAHLETLARSSKKEGL